ncbi:hypothetical protein DFJ73DRAFT_758694 [Zopfochytrium polystomum]|nr:hypothetical protein DFJ73DRAFT_758694 [Zopfochytrium polystomum]
MTKNKGKQPAVSGTTRSNRLPKASDPRESASSGSVPSAPTFATTSSAAPTMQLTSPAAACSSAAPKLTPGNMSPTSAFATAGTQTRLSTAPEGRSIAVVPTIPSACDPVLKASPHSLQQQGAVANNHAVNQQYYSLQQRAAEYACVATEMRVCHDLERKEQPTRRAGARNAAARQVATPAAATPTSVVPAALPTAVNAPSTTPTDVDHDATPVAAISPN